MTGISDSFARPINYLRISVTDRCNFRCVYCMPLEGIETLHHSEILSYEEILLIARAAARLGINKVRLTGGEPLVRADLPYLVEMLSAIDGIDDLTLTTNGSLLSRYARELKDAGLRRVNISLDTLRPERFEQITRLGRLEDVFRGADMAEEVGLYPVKFNTVVMRGINDDEIVDFARKTLDDGWHVRFIEFMPIGEPAGKNDGRFISIPEITGHIEKLGDLEPGKLDGNGPARYYRLPAATGTIGFISPVSNHFCFQCNRLRLTADGGLRSCLLSDAEIDLKAPLRQGASVEDLKRLIEQAIEAKPKGHKLGAGATGWNRNMCQIGG